MSKKTYFGYSKIESPRYEAFGDPPEYSHIDRAILYFRHDYTFVQQEFEDFLDASEPFVGEADELDPRVAASIVLNFHMTLRVQRFNLIKDVERLCEARGKALTEAEEQSLEASIYFFEDIAADMGAVVEWATFHNEHSDALSETFARSAWREEGRQAALRARVDQGKRAFANVLEAVTSLWHERPELAANIAESARAIEALNLDQLKKPDGSSLGSASIEKYIRKAKQQGELSQNFPRNFRNTE